MDDFAYQLLSGRRRGVAPALLRAGLSVAEVPYAAAMRVRNRLYDSGSFKAERLARPVISVGNITVGGTGKTPVVRWLAERLAAEGLRPAVLMRGYSKAGGASDEQAMLAGQLASLPGAPPAPVVADPDRLRGASKALAQQPKTDVFILDDGMQHRRVARDFELTLVSAPEPFGFGHVLPRGLLREPLAGFRRSSAFLLTRTDQVEPTRPREIEAALRRYNGEAPIFHSRHALTGLRDGDSPVDPAAAASTPLFAFCGIGTPESFTTQLRAAGLNVVGRHFFDDHHAYTPADVQMLVGRAQAANARALVITEKDWPKLFPLLAATPPALPFWRSELAIRFAADHESRLFATILEHIRKKRP